MFILCQWVIGVWNIGTAVLADDRRVIMLLQLYMLAVYTIIRLIVVHQNLLQS